MGQPQGSAAHRAGFAAVAALAGVVVLVFVVSGMVPENRSTALLQDDVNHDSALGAVFSGHGGREARGIRGRREARSSSLDKDASVSDFFKAALNGEFSKGGAVKDATAGIFDNHSANQGMARAHRRRENHALKAPHQAREQALAETKLRIKAAHAALAAEAHADRRVLNNNREAAQRAAGLRVVANSRENQMLSLIKKKEQKLAQKYPSEDKFVARYTGSVPSSDVPVDSFTFGSYVPI